MTDIPGFIDLQVNGYKGVDFSSPELTEEQFAYACRELLQNGALLFLPTLISSSAEVYRQNLGIISRALKHSDFKDHIPGIHLEGPFISPEDGARGAHSREWVRQPDIPLLDQLIKWSENTIRLITIAAEGKGAETLCRHARSRGIKVSLGHQLASYDQIEALAGAGAAAMTHLGNGIPHLIHRHDNPVYAGLLLDNLDAMIIADGFHLPPALIRLILKVKGCRRTILVSDQSPVAGLPPGTYRTLGNEAVLEESGRLFNPNTGYLVGSSFTLLDCANYLLSAGIANKEEILEMAFTNPLRWLGIDKKELPPEGGKVYYSDSVFLVEGEKSAGPSS